jgi:hypothetical protein
VITGRGRRLDESKEREEVRGDVHLTAACADLQQVVEGACFCVAGAAPAIGSSASISLESVPYDATLTCEQCLPGSYKDSASNEQCTSCPEDSSSDLIGATSRTECVCDAGFVGELADPDSECMAGAFRDAGSVRLGEVDS